MTGKHSIDKVRQEIVCTFFFNSVCLLVLTILCFAALNTMQTQIDELSKRIVEIKDINQHVIPQSVETPSVPIPRIIPRNVHAISISETAVQNSDWWNSHSWPRAIRK